MKLLLFPMLLISYQIQFLSAWMILTIVAVFCLMLALNRLIAKRTRRRLDRSSAVSELMQQALRVSNNNVVRYDIRKGRISNLSGTFLPPGGATVEEWKQRVHPDDLEATLESFRRIINGEQERAEFFYRWRYDDGGKEPLWGVMHNISLVEYQQKTRHIIGIVSTLWDEAELVRQEKEANSLTNKYKQIFEHSIIGLSFYTPDGWLVDANKIMRQICNFDSETGDAFFSSVNLFDVAPFSEVLDRNNVEELWICSLSVVPERNMYLYLEIRLRPIVDDEGKLLYLAIATRDITEERNLYLQVMENDRRIQQVNESIRLYEEELRYMQTYVDRGYDTFLSIVAEGRGTTKEQVHEIAQGRVWLATDALGIKLVDKIGSLDDAVKKAAELAKVENYYTDSYPGKTSWFDQLLQSTEKKKGTYLDGELQETLGELYEPLKELRKDRQRNRLQARLPFSTSIR